MTKLVSVRHNDNDEERMGLIWACWRDEAISRGITMDAVNHTLMVDPHIVYKVHKK